MADDDLTSAPEERDDSLPITVPSHDELPPPPEVHYTRPILNQGVASRKSMRQPGDAGVSGAGPDGSAWGRGLSVSVTLATTIIGGYFLGHWMDNHLHHGAAQIWWTLTMSIVGFGVGFVNVVRLTTGWGKDGNRK